MSEAVESGGALAWRVLTALEGGALLAGGAALMAHRWRAATMAARKHTTDEHAKTIFISNATDPLGLKLVSELEARGCRVTSPATEANGANEASEQVDALIVIGATPKVGGLEGLSDLVTKDVYDNLKLVETLIRRVRRGGRVVWAACTGDATSGAFTAAYDAFDSVLQTQLQFIASGAQCNAVWIGRCRSPQEVTDSVIATVLPSKTYLVRNLAVRLRDYLGRWLKIIS